MQLNSINIQEKIDEGRIVFEFSFENNFFGEVMFDREFMDEPTYDDKTTEDMKSKKIDEKTVSLKLKQAIEEKQFFKAN